MAIFGFGKKKETACDCNTNTKGASCCGGVDGDSLKAAETKNNEGAAIKVLGTGCAKCNQLEANTKEALKQLQMDDTVDHVTDLSQIVSYGVMSTPALVIDGKVVSYGKVPKVEEVVDMLQKSRG